MRLKKICINKNVLSSAKKAYNLYNARIEEEKRKMVEKINKKQEQAVLNEKHSDELKSIQIDQRAVCEEQQTIRNYANRIMMVCLENHLVKSISRHIHKTAAWTNISVTDT